MDSGQGLSDPAGAQAEPSAIAAARTAVETGRFDEAIDLLRGHVSEHPDDVTGWHRLAGAYIGAGEHVRAVEAADRSIAIEAHNAVAHRMRAIALLRLARFGEAVRSAAIAVQLSPPHADAHAVLGQAQLFGFRNRTAAAAAARAALTLDPTNGPATDLVDCLRRGNRSGAVLLCAQSAFIPTLVLGALTALLAGEPGIIPLGVAFTASATAMIVLGVTARRLARRTIVLFPGTRLVAAALLTTGALTGAALALSDIRLPIAAVIALSSTCATLLLFTMAWWRRATTSTT
jgi:tetratricopeptide (TPR) repeat protein